MSRQLSKQSSKRSGMEPSRESTEQMTPRATFAEQTTNRRAFIRTGLAAGAGGVGVALLGAGAPAYAARIARRASSSLPSGDVAILRFLAVLETIEADLWQQYNELGGIQDSEAPGGSGSAPYAKALRQLDTDMSQYIHDNTDDEFSHFTFINAFLVANGLQTVSLKPFRTLQGSQASGADKDRKRITNLMKLSVDTSWWTRYRSDTENPDLGDSFPQALPALSKGKFPAIPRTDADLAPKNHIQAIANTAAFHFAFIEQGGSSLYPSLAQRVSDPVVLRILLSIGPTETSHFQTWHDKAGNAVSQPLAPLTDPTNGLTFPDLNAAHTQLLQTNLIMPEPTKFLNRMFPAVSIIRPTETVGAAMGAVQALTDDGLFAGQSSAFFDLLKELAQAADAAQR